MAGENAALAQHIKNCQDSAISGHRNAITFLSKTFINNALFTIREYLVEKIVETINRSGCCFGLLMDGSQDVSTKEQISVVVRYINDTYDVVERTISFFNAKDTSGEALYARLGTTLSDVGLSLSNIVGCSFDGASNMRGEFSGLRSFIKRDNVNCIYVWCLSHQFNVAVNFATKRSNPITKILNIAEDSAKMFRASYIKMNIWIEVAKSMPRFNSQKRLKLIGTTRWSSKQNALATIISTEASLVVLIKALIKICGLKTLERRKLEEATENLNSWVNYETIVTTHVLHKIFTLINETCISMQKSGKSFLEGIASLNKCNEKLNNVKDQIGNHFDEGDEFVRRTIKLINDDVEIQSHQFEILRLPTEEERLEIIRNLQIEICMFIQTLQDRIINYILVQFDQKDSLYHEVQSLDPLHAKAILMNDNIESFRMTKLCEINNVDQKIVTQELRELISDFFRCHNRHQYVSVLNNNNKDDNVDEESDEEEITVLIEDETDFDETMADAQFKNVKFEKMSKICYCSLCILKYIGSDDGRKGKFANILRLYKYIALIPSTQVKCERDFSKMKLIKTRLRASLSK